MNLENNDKKRQKRNKLIPIIVIAAIAGTFSFFMDAVQEKENSQSAADIEKINSFVEDFKKDVDNQAEKVQFALRINKAVLDRDAGVISIVAENVSNVNCDRFCTIELLDSAVSQDYICMFTPKSYYEGVSEQVNGYLDYRTVVPPQQETVIKYQVEEYYMDNIDRAISESGGIWVAFIDDAERNSVCLLETE